MNEKNKRKESKKKTTRKTILTSSHTVSAVIITIRLSGEYLHKESLNRKTEAFQLISFTRYLTLDIPPRTPINPSKIISPALVCTTFAYTPRRSLVFL